MQARLDFEDSSALARLSRMDDINWREALARFGGYFVRALGEQIETAGPGDRAGTGRGVDWAPLRPLYVRADGTVVPAWGGAPKVRGQGTVQGRRQAGGAIRRGPAVFPGLRGGNRAGKLLTRRLTAEYLEIGTTRLFGGYQDSMRQFLFFQDPKDIRALESIANAFLRGEISGKSKRRR